MKYSEVLEEKIRDTVPRTASHLRRLADEVESLEGKPVHVIPGRLASILSWGYASLNEEGASRLLGDLLVTREAEEA